MNWTLVLWPALIVWALFTLFYGIARLKDDYSVIDICWGLGFLATVITQTLTFIFKGWSLSPVHITLIVLVSLWSLRLAGYIAYRNRKKGEDERYTQMREDWGDKAPLYFYFFVYCLQAFLCLLVGSGLIVTFSQRSLSIGPWFYAGTAVALFGWFYESLADYQKDRFKSKEENRGKPCREGLWYYSRHPNYFGEMVFWWGLFLFSVPTDYTGWCLIGPLTICLFLIKVSGVPLLEKKYNKKPAYKEYLETTNTFIPWPPSEAS